MHEQLHKTTRDTSFDDCLNLVIGTIRQVGDSPAGINQNFIVKGIDKLSENRKGRENLLTLLADVI